MINIGGYNNGYGNSYEYGNPYDLKKLDGDSSIYFKIPSDIILDSDKGSRRASVFSFFAIKRGLDGEVTFSIEDVVRWTGKNPRRGTGRINNATLDTIRLLEGDGYIKTYEQPRDSMRTQAVFYSDKVNNLCDGFRFATIYLDELKDIFNYKSTEKEMTIDNDVMLLVFAYLRMKIPRRQNALFAEQTNIDGKKDHGYDVDVRRKKHPDVFDGYFGDIASEIGTTDKIVSKAASILKDIGLIYYESLPRTKIGDKWNTNATLFCNYYYRNGNSILADGMEYYEREIQNKKDKLNKLKRAKKK